MLYRENYIQKIAGFKDMDVIKVITGLRRSGKSTIMRQVQEYYEKTGISPNQILYYICILRMKFNIFKVAAICS